MANAHIPKHGVSSPACDGRALPKHDCRRRSHIVLWLTLVAFFSVVLGLCAAEVAYSGAGNISYRVFSPTGDGSTVIEKKFSFQFACNDNLWKIQLKDIGDSDFERYNAFNDGTNTYILTTVKKEVFIRKTTELSEADKSLNTNLICYRFNWRHNFCRSAVVAFLGS